MTWFEGDAYKAVQVIRPRVEALLRANPWLLGSLRSSSRNTRNDVASMRLEYNTSSPSADKLDETTIDKIFQFLPCVDGDFVFRYGMDMTEIASVTRVSVVAVTVASYVYVLNKSVGVPSAQNQVQCPRS